MAQRVENRYRVVSFGSVPALLSRLNPFRSLPNPREVFAWGMYDFANQSFTLLILTLLFPIYVRKVAVTAPGAERLVPGSR